MPLKIFRRLHPGVRPDVEIRRFLTETAKFANTPRLLGVADYIDPAGVPTTLATLETFVRSQGDAWTWTLEALRRILEALAMAPVEIDPGDAVAPAGFSTYAPHVRRLGLRTGEMHQALATPTSDLAFKAEPLTLADVRVAVEDAREAAARGFARAAALANSPGGADRADIGGSSTASSNAAGCSTCWSKSRWRDQDPHPRRLSSWPRARRQGRRHHGRLRRLRPRRRR